MPGSLSGRSFLVTGGTGSLGQAMVHRLLDAGAGRIRVLSRDETKQEAMRQRVRDDRVRYYVGDIRDRDAVVKATRGVDYVFHAAALKQVPSCEFFPLEAVRTNVLGSANLVDACERNGVAVLILLSTDKAVYPVNVMGMTKGLMEKIAQAQARMHPHSATKVACVRYGNVMYSRGSVLPLFVEQAKNSQPLTVTDPAMTRFLMSLTESIKLVEHAFTHAESGDIFVRKASACTIGDLATAVSTLFGAPEKLELLGVRHGERMHETLVGEEELARADNLGDFLRIPADTRGLNYALYLEQCEPDRALHNGYTSATATRLDVPEITSLLLSIPEVRTQLSGVGDLAVIGCPDTVS